MGNEFIRSQAYQDRITGEVVRMERLNNNRVVLHLSSGPERVMECDLKGGYAFLGSWINYENGLLECK